MRLLSGNMQDQRHADLPAREVAVVRPIVHMVLIELLSVITGEHDDRVLVEFLTLQHREHPGQEEVDVVATVAIEVEKRRGVHVVGQFGIVSL